MNSLLLFLTSLCAATLSLSSRAQAPATEHPAPKLGSTIFKFEDLAVKATGVGERRDVARNPTATLREFECHISTLNPNLASHPPHTHPQEELIILRDGELDVHINGNSTKVGPGTLFFFASNDPHAVQNRGTTPATYFVFNFSTAATLARRGQPRVDDAPGRLGSAIFHWDKLNPVPTKTGQRRAVTDLPTLTLANFECHVTTLNAGEAPHAAHRHPDEEIILVKEGRLEVTVNGHTQTVGPGGIIFVSSNDEHGVKNAGTSATTYYVMRLKTEATPVKL